jgi:hypothetical protein
MTCPGRGRRERCQAHSVRAGFYEQAWSDWQAYEALTRVSELPRCHALHYLQMACQKLGKAYRLRNPGSKLLDLAPDPHPISHHEPGGRAVLAGPIARVV